MASNQPNANESEMYNPLLCLLQLSKLARNSESAEALQFLLVNQTHKLLPYTLAILWVSDEGVLAQSGVSLVERNAPFIQWINGLATKFADSIKPIPITIDLLDSESIKEWGEYLPANAVWFPVNFETPDKKSGFLICRDDPWADQEIALLQEWVEIWTHSWVRMHQPSVHGELTKFWRHIHSHIPTLDELKEEAAYLQLGGRGFYRNYLKHPFRLISLFSEIFRTWLYKGYSNIKLIKKDGLSGTKDRLVSRLKAIWTDPKKRYQWLLVIIIFFPVRLTVLASAELVPENPAIIRSPIEGVIDEFFVSPNQMVAEGQPLFKLDLTTLNSRLNVAEQETQIASSEFRQSTLQSLSDSKSRAQLVPQEGKAAQKKVEADYLRELLAKAQIKAPRSGLVLFDDPSEWIGKPVVAGEKVMVIASEKNVEIEAWVPVSDAITFPQNAKTILFLNATPLTPIDGKMRYIGHEAQLRPDGTYAYRLRAKLDPGEEGARVGLKGTAKISGQYVPFGYLIMRKPLSAIRQFLGI